MNKAIFNFCHTYETNMAMYDLMLDMISKSSHPDIFMKSLNGEAVKCLTNLTRITNKEQLKIFGPIDKQTHCDHLANLFAERLRYPEFNVFFYFGFPKYFELTPNLESKGFKVAEVLTPGEIEEMAFKAEDLGDFVVKEIEASLGQISIDECLSVLLGAREYPQRHLIVNATARLSLLLINGIIDRPDCTRNSGSTGSIEDHLNYERLKSLAISLNHIIAKSQTSLLNGKLRMSSYFRCNRDTKITPKAIADLSNLFL